MTKIKAFYIPVPVWNDGCWIAFPLDKDSAAKWYNKKFKPESPESFDQLENAYALAVLGSPRVIILTEWKNTPDWVSHLAHEVVHIANYMLKESGVKEKEGCDESLAYLVGYLLFQFLTKIKPYGRENK